MRTKKLINQPVWGTPSGLNCAATRDSRGRRTLGFLTKKIHKNLMQKQHNLSMFLKKKTKQHREIIGGDIAHD